MTSEPDDEDLLRRYPDVRLDHDNKEYYRGLQARELRLNRCLNCEHWHGPPLRAVCPACWSFEVAATPVSGSGTVVLVTRLHQGRALEGVSYDPPYPLVAVELIEQPGLRVSATVRADPDTDLAPGMPVRLAWEERAGNPYPVFRVVG
jgi:uncharacterized OB-fold protein